MIYLPKIYKHKLNNKKYTIVKATTKHIQDFGDLSGIIFADCESGKKKFLSNHQVERLMEAVK